MEFFRSLVSAYSADDLQSTLSVDSLDNWSEFLFVQEHLDQNRATVAGIWGEFTLERSCIEDGCRFALKECPYALAWTVSSGMRHGKPEITIHLTVNRSTLCTVFKDEIEEFLDDLQSRIPQYILK